jgi:hypothetical protein
MGAAALVCLSAIGLAALAFNGRPRQPASPGGASLDISQQLEAEYEAMRATAEAEVRAAEMRQNEEMNLAAEALLAEPADAPLDVALPDEPPLAEEPAVEPGPPAEKATDPGPVRVFSREIYLRRKAEDKAAATGKREP